MREMKTHSVLDISQNHCEMLDWGVIVAQLAPILTRLGDEVVARVGLSNSQKELFAGRMRGKQVRRGEEVKERGVKLSKPIIPKAEECRRRSKPVRTGMKDTTRSKGEPARAATPDGVPRRGGEATEIPSPTGITQRGEKARESGHQRTFLCQREAGYELQSRTQESKYYPKGYWTSSSLAFVKPVLDKLGSSRFSDLRANYLLVMWDQFSTGRKKALFSGLAADSCPLCGYPDSMDHVALRCSATALEEKRKELWTDVNRPYLFGRV
jgi:hypothetical protein